MTTIDRHLIDVRGTTLEMRGQGTGRPLLFLHGCEGADRPWERTLNALARRYRVYAPCHPGFGGLDRPKDIREVSDLAYLYLDLAEICDLSDAILMGSSFGAWIAAEMAIRNASRFSSLILSGPLGIKVRGRDMRDIEDIFAMSYDEFVAVAYADAAKARPALSELNDDDLLRHFGAWESLAHFGWKPYMHNPQLKRWLHRIPIPTAIIVGAEDRLVFDGYYRAYHESIPGSQLLAIEEAGHFPHIEQAEPFVDIVERFMTGALSPLRSQGA